MNTKLIEYNGIPIYRTFFGDNINEDNSISLIAKAWYKNSSIPSNSQHKVILANSEEEKEFYENNYDVDVLFCNHNAFLNETRYIIKDDVKKEYNMVISSCFRNYKRIWLAKDIPDILHIGYKNGPLEYIPDFGTRANFKNNSTNMEDWDFFCTKKYVNLLNSSVCGGMFSEVEGACFSSSEYLLCGLPVLSTPSKGGRDVFYNSQNSIICEPSVDGVTKGYNDIMTNLHKFDRYAIRETKLQQMDIFRNRLTEYVKDKLEDVYKITVDLPQLKSLLSYYDNSNEW